MESLKILLLSIAAVVAYGVLHDQITARVCLEYFTVGHPPIFSTADPNALAFAWGTLGTVWMGLLLGLPLALIAAAGPRPKVRAHDLLCPLAVSISCVALLALVAGTVGFVLAQAGLVHLGGPLAQWVSPEKQSAFLADAWAHAAAYTGGSVAGFLLWSWAGQRRDKLTRIGATRWPSYDP